MGNGMSKIVDGLYLGNIRDSEDRENLVKHGITHILSVHNNAKPLLEDMTYLCISASDSSSQNLQELLSSEILLLKMPRILSTCPPVSSHRDGWIQHFKECIRFIHECRLHRGGCLVHCLAGVSRSTTILVAYLMTVTSLGWEECLAATKAVRSYVSPNFGFQQQLQEYERTLLKEYRAWIWQEYGKNPLHDQEELQRLLSQQEEKQAGLREMSWINAPSPSSSRPHNTYASGSSSSGSSSGSSSRWMNR